MRRRVSLVFLIVFLIALPLAMPAILPSSGLFFGKLHEEFGLSYQPSTEDSSERQEPDFTISLDPPSLTVYAGETASFKVIITTSGGFSATLKFSVSGVPPATLHEFKATPTALLFKVYTTGSTPAGTYNITITATGGGKTHRASALLTVISPGGSGAPDFKVIVKPSSRTVMPGKTANFTISFVPIGGFSSSVKYTVSGIPPGSYFEIDREDSKIILKIVTTGATPQGVYKIKITGTGGGKKHTEEVTLIVGSATTTKTTTSGIEEFSASVMPATLRVNPGDSGAITVRVSGKEFDKSVMIRVLELPPGVTAVADINNTKPDFVSLVRVTVPPDTAPGTYKLGIKVMGGGIEKEYGVTLIISGAETSVPITGTASQPSQTTQTGTSMAAAFDFSLTVSPQSLSLQKGGSNSVAVTVQQISGKAKPVRLSVKGLPPDATYQISPQTVMPGSTASLLIKASETTGTFTVIVEGSADSVIRSTSFTLIVEKGESRCIIATTAYGSELDPRVSMLRKFRDSYVMRTYAGSRFMTVFNAFYYSWSPYVADLIRESESMKFSARIALAPLIGILSMSEGLVSKLWSLNSEMAVVLGGVVASALIGIVYLLPLMTLGVMLSSRFRKLITRISRKVVIGTWLLCIITLVIGVLGFIEVATMIAASLLVLASLVGSSLGILRIALNDSE